MNEIKFDRYQEAKKLGYTDQEIAYFEALQHVLRYWNDELTKNNTPENYHPLPKLGMRIMAPLRQYTSALLNLKFRANLAADKKKVVEKKSSQKLRA